MNDYLMRIYEIAGRAHGRYGDYTSTHEALGVISEEWDELRAAIHANDIPAVRAEALDIAAACYRLAMACDEPYMLARSTK